MESNERRGPSPARSLFSPAASTAIPSSFSPTPTMATSIDELNEMMLPMGLRSVPPAFGQLMSMVPQDQCGTTFATPFGVASKSVTTSTGVNENGQKFTQQHYTVNMQEWYTPMLAARNAIDASKSVFEITCYRLCSCCSGIQISKFV